MTTTYQIDPSHTTVNFSVKHMMIAKVHGGFKKISGKLLYDAKNTAGSSVEVAIEANSINTHDAERDQHLRSADFFNVEKYPTINFKSIRFDQDGDNLRVEGDLTIHGVTRPITLKIERPSKELKDPSGNITIGFSGKTKIKRKDFGLIWSPALEAGGVLVGDEISISFDVQLVKVI